MTEDLNFDDKLVIIKNAGLEDAEILDKNYRHMFRDATDPIKIQEIITLHGKVIDRIKELVK